MKHILIIKLAAIGDVIMALPMVSVLKTEYKDCHITWVCGNGVSPLVQKTPVDKIIQVDEKLLLRGSKVDKCKEVLKVWKEIAFKKYDIIAMGHADRRYKILTCLSKADEYHSFNHAIGNMWPIPGRHHTDEYVRLVMDHMDKKKIVRPFQMDPDVDAYIDSVLENKNKVVTLAPGGAKNLLADDFCRRWPIENYISLTKALIDEGYTVVLSGAKSDQWILPYFSGLNVINLVGKTNLSQLLYLFSRSGVVVTHDSGPMHLAGMTNCRLIAVFGPTNPYEKVPRQERVKIFWHPENYSCCPCYDGKTYAKCNDNLCMKSTRVSDVLTEVSLMMN